MQIGLRQAAGDCADDEECSFRFATASGNVSVWRSETRSLSQAKKPIWVIERA